MSDETRHLVQIRPKLYADIKEYCQLNNFKIGWFINDLLQKSFMTEKYGESPFTRWIEPSVVTNEELPYFDIEEKNNEYVEQIYTESSETIAIPIKKEITSELSAISQNIIEQTSESQSIIDKHIEQLNKPKKRRLK